MKDKNDTHKTSFFDRYLIGYRPYSNGISAHVLKILIVCLLLLSSMTSYGSEKSLFIKWPSKFPIFMFESTKKKKEKDNVTQMHDLISA